MRKTVIHTSNAAVTGAPLVQAVRFGNLLFPSGQSPRDPRNDNRVVDGGMREHARQSLENLRAVLEAAGSGLPHVLKATCYVVDIDSNLVPLNEVWREYFGDNLPARTVLGVAKLRENYLCEIEAVAYVPE